MMLGHYIAIKSCFNDKYLSLSNDGKIYFNQNDIKNCFILIMRYIGKYVTFQDKNNKYLSYNAYYNCLELNKDISGESERFEIEWLNEDWFALKSNIGLYVSIQKDGKIEVNQKNIVENAQFNLTVKNVESLFEFLRF